VTEPLTLPSTTAAGTTHEHVREIIRHWILTGTLPAGAKLRQAEIARHTGASTTPVREALRELAVEGLVTFDAHRGAVVRAVDLQEMLEIYDLRRVLEPYAAGRAATTITPGEIETASSILDRMAETEEPAEWSVMNRDFHAVVVDAAKSARLSAMIKSLRDSSILFIGTSTTQDHGRMRRGDVDHREILGALMRRDAREAERLTLAHLNGTIAAAGLEATRMDPAVGEGRAK